MGFGDERRHSRIRSKFSSLEMSSEATSSVFHCFRIVSQLSTNIRNAINSWNTGTNVWLRFLVYERLDKKYESSKTAFTFLLSAVWHGVYPGYYLCFLTAALLVSSARSVSKFGNRVKSFDLLRIDSTTFYVSLSGS